MACGIFLDQGSNLYHLHWQADSYPLYQTGKSSISFFSRNFQFISHRLLPDYIFLYTFILTIRSASLIYFLWFQPGFWRESNVSNTPLLYVHMCVWVTQSSPTLCNPMHYSSPGSSAHGILQARILEWVAIPFSRVSSQPRDWTQVSHIAGRFFTVWATRESRFKTWLLWSLAAKKYVLQSCKRDIIVNTACYCEFIKSCEGWRIVFWENEGMGWDKSDKCVVERFKESLWSGV